VLDALGQALYDRQPEPTNALIHHSDRGFGSIRYTERLVEAGIETRATDRCNFFATLYRDPLASAIPL